MAGRRKLPPAVIDGESSELITGPLDAEREREVNERQQLAVAEYGDGLPWSPTHYEAEIRAELSRGVSAFLRAGRLLTVARECAAHGEWSGMLERLGMEPRQAQRMMLAARRVAGLPNASRATHLVEAAGTQSKFIELLSLPEDQFAELATDGKTGDLDVDEIAGMTRDELRRAIREARDTIEAKDQRAGERERKIEQLQRDLAKAKRQRAKATPDEVAESLRAGCSTAVMSVRAELTGVTEAIAELLAHDAETGGDNSTYIAGLLHELLTDIRVIRDNHALPIVGED